VKVSRGGNAKCSQSRAPPSPGALRAPASPASGRGEDGVAKFGHCKKRAALAAPVVETVCASRLFRFPLSFYWIVPVNVTPEYVENARTPT